MSEAFRRSIPRRPTSVAPPRNWISIAFDRPDWHPTIKDCAASNAHEQRLASDCSCHATDPQEGHCDLQQPVVPEEPVCEVLDSSAPIQGCPDGGPPPSFVHIQGH